MHRGSQDWLGKEVLDFLHETQAISSRCEAAIPSKRHISSRPCLDPAVHDDGPYGYVGHGHHERRRQEARYSKSYEAIEDGDLKCPHIHPSECWIPKRSGDEFAADPGGDLCADSVQYLQVPSLLFPGLFRFCPQLSHDLLQRFCVDLVEHHNRGEYLRATHGDADIDRGGSQHRKGGSI
jgi:hypothetical protein